MRIPGRRGEHRLELPKYIEMERQRIAHVHVLVVPPHPSEGFPITRLETGEIDLSARQELALCLREVLADHGYQGYGSEEAGGIGKIRCGPPKYPIPLSERCFHRINGNGSDNGQRACGLCSSEVNFS